MGIDDVVVARGAQLVVVWQWRGARAGGRVAVVRGAEVVVVWR